MQPFAEFLIALGANLNSLAGTPEMTLRSALNLFPEKGANVIAVSRFYRTPCFPPGAGPDYVNAAAVIGHNGDVPAVLAMLHEIEAAFGRERTCRWGQRTLDLDLIAAGDMIAPDRDAQTEWRCLPADQQTSRTPDKLILPHPRIQDRGFVLIPLADVAPDWRHPILGLTVAQMLAALPPAAHDEIVPLNAV